VREDVPGLLARLEEKSLIGVDRQPEWTRYRMLQMVREYAAEQLPESESAEIAGRHVEYFLQMAEEAEANISGPQQADLLKRLDRDHDNMRAALETCKQNPDLLESGLRLAGSLARYWHIRGILSEGRRFVSSLIALAPPQSDRIALSQAENGLGILCWAQGDYQSARRSFNRALECWTELRDSARCANALSNIGLVSVALGDLERAEETLQASLAIREKAEDSVGIASSLNNLGLLARQAGQFEKARDFYARSLDVRKKLVDKGGEAACLNNLGEIAFHLNEYAESNELYGRALEIFRELKDRSGIAVTLHNAAELAFKLGNYAESLSNVEEASSHASAIGHRWLIAVSPLRRADCYLALNRSREGLAIYRQCLDSLMDEDVVGERWECIARLAMYGTNGHNLDVTARVLSACHQAIEGSPSAWISLPAFEKAFSILEDELGFEQLAREMEAGKRMSLEEAADQMMKMVPYQ
jgi:tetratricopeptide (TPR) repeat protein